MKKFYGTGKLDAVVTDTYNNKYYIPCVVGDIKAHTYDNGIVQTWWQYKSNSECEFSADPTRTSDYDGLSCIEFIDPLDKKTSGISDYAIDSIIFYDNV